MRDLKTDDSGQWLLLGTMIVAIGLAVLIVFVNQSVLAGHSSSGSIMDFPKNDIREFRYETLNEAYLLGVAANLNGTSLADRQSRFASAYDTFAGQIRYVYSARGADANIKFEAVPDGQYLDYINMSIDYDNGDTQYNESMTIYLK